MALYVKFDCATCENENCTGHGLPTTEKVCDGYKHTRTNADRIRAMADEELAMKLSEIEYSAVMSDKAWHPAKWLDWLRQTAEECE